MKTILVPVDFSSATARVCDAAAELARLTGSRLLLLHVVQNPPFLMNDYYAFDVGMMADVVASTEKAARKTLGEWERRYAKKSPAVVAMLANGLPSAVIVKQALTRKAAYIVIGSHGHGAVFDLFVGSTTHRVLRKARCPVLVVPIGKR